MHICKLESDEQIPLIDPCHVATWCRQHQTFLSSPLPLPQWWYVRVSNCEGERGPTNTHLMGRGPGTHVASVERKQVANQSVRVGMLFE